MKKNPMAYPRIPPKNRGDGANGQLEMNAFGPVGNDHGDQHEIRGQGKERAFGKGNTGQDPARRRAVGLAHKPLI
jgi:hypothetical protein